MKKLLIFILVLLYSSLKGQTQSPPYEVVDRFCKCPEFRWNGNFFVLKDIVQSDNDVEVRLTVTYIHQDEDITVLTKKNGKYDAYYYNKLSSTDIPVDSLKAYGKWEIHPAKKFHITGINLDSVFNVLKQKKTFDQPNMKDVYKGAFYSTAKLEYKINGKVGAYIFGPPIPYMPTDESELKVIKRYYAISDVFTFLGEKYNTKKFRSAFE